MDGAAEIRVLSPTAILGYGFPESSFAAGLARGLVIQATAAEPVEHPKRIGQLGSPERSLEEERDPQVMGRMVSAGAGRVGGGAVGWEASPIPIAAGSKQ